MVQRIVVGIENSKLTDDAVTRALELSGRFDVGVDVVHAVNFDQPHWWNGDLWGQARTDVLAQSRRVLGRRLEQLIEAGGHHGLRVEGMLQVVTGRPSQALRRFATSHHAALLVLGRHHDHNVFDFGCTTREIVSEAPCPVWVQNGPVERVRRILVPVDLSPAMWETLGVAHILASRVGARMSILNCYEAPDFFYDEDEGTRAVVTDHCRRQRLEFEQLAASPRLAGVPFTTEFVEGEVAPTILARAADADLIVMGTQGHSAVEQLMLGSQAYRVLREARLPVLVVPQHRVDDASGARGVT